MTDVLSTAGVGLGGAAFIAVGAPVLVRLWRGRTPMYAHILVAAVAETIVAFAGILFVDGFDFWLATSLTGLAAVANLFAFSAVYKSVSLRMVLYLAREPSRSAAFEALVKNVVEPMVDSRLSVLQSMELVERRGDGRYQPTDSGRRCAERLQQLQRLFGITRSGLYSGDAE